MLLTGLLEKQYSDLFSKLSNTMYGSQNPCNNNSNSDQSCNLITSGKLQAAVWKHRGHIENADPIPRTTFRVGSSIFQEKHTHTLVTCSQTLIQKQVYSLVLWVWMSNPQTSTPSRAVGLHPYLWRPCLKWLDTSSQPTNTQAQGLCLHLEYLKPSGLPHVHQTAIERRRVERNTAQNTKTNFLISHYTEKLKHIDVSCVTWDIYII